MDGIILQCNDAYSIGRQDDSPYGVGWVPFEGNSTVNNSRLEYTYSSWRDLNSYPISGTQAFYAGGGYLVELKGNLSDVIDTLQQLQAEKWVDGYTRAVIFEFTIYNAQVNLFAVVTYLVEFLPTNGIETMYNINVVNLLGFYSSAMLLQMACEVIFVIFVAFFFVKEIRSVIKLRRRYFFSIWNWVEMTTIGLSVSGIAIYFYRYFETLRLVEIFAETSGNTFINFQYVAMWNELLLCMVGFLVFFSTLKFAKLLRFNKNIGFISSTLKFAAPALLAFGFCFFVIFMAFVIFFFLIFSSELTEFMTFISSLEMCFEMLVGKFSFADMVRTSPILGPLFFFIYIVIVFCILVNMFVIILNKSFAQVRADISKQSNEYEIVNFMVDSFLKWSGLGSTLQSLGLMKRPEPAANTEVDEEAEVQRLSHNALQHIEQFPGRLDRLLDTVCKMYFNIDHFDDCFPQGQDSKEMMKKLTAESKQNTMTRGKAAMAALGGRQQLPEVE
jgi:polycystin 1L2